MADGARVYDYNKDAVRDAIVGAFKKRRGEAAPADIVAFTGLPKPQVDAELPAVADEFGGRLKVTDSGEILYSFPDGFRSRYRGFGPGLKRFMKAFGKGAAAVGAFLFKAWIMVMLIGYFALFIALAVLAVLASFAASASDKDKRSSRGGTSLVTGLIDVFIRIWFYNEVFKGPGQRRYESDARSRRKENRRPLHKAIFSFVLGELDPNADHDSVEKRAFVALARAKKGVVLLEDFMAVTGLSPDAADTAINRYLYEFEGSPEVSDDGTVYYHFPKLLLRSRADEAGASDSPLKRLRPFSANASKSNVAYAAINGVNIAFGSYFIYGSMAAGTVAQRPDSLGIYLSWFVAHLFAQFTADPLGLMFIGLGIVPLAFSVLFWTVPAIRAGKLAKENERIKESNMRRLVYANAVASPSSLRAPDPASLPESARPKKADAPRKVVEELAAYERAEAIDGGKAWRLAELERKAADAEKVRASVKPGDYSLGSIAFDSGK